MKFAKVLENCSSSKDGHRINVRKFAEAGVTLKSADINAANAAKDFLDSHGKKSIFLKEVKERRASLFEDNEVLPWKANVLEFYTHITEDLMPVIDELPSLAGEINLKLKSTSFPCVEKSTLKRKKVNAAKGREREKAEATEKCM